MEHFSKLSSHKGKNKIFKICLTGGPCSGKTSSLSKIKEIFSNEFKVICIPEVATMTFSSGVTIIPSEFNNQSHITFTESICQMQIDIENYFYQFAKTENKDVILVSDRGVCDNFAFCSLETKNSVLEKNGWTMNYLCNERYDLVIHLVTAALGAEKYYTLENNVARSETKEQSVKLDKLLQNEYVNHPNHIIIDNFKISFEEKLDKMINNIKILIGLEESITYQSFIINSNNIEKILSEKASLCTTIHEKLTYIGNLGLGESWLSKKKADSEYWPYYRHYSKTIPTKDCKSLETQKLISKKAYKDYLKQIIGKKSSVKKNIKLFLLEIYGKIDKIYFETVNFGCDQYYIIRLPSKLIMTEMFDKFEVNNKISETEEYLNLKMLKQISDF